MPNDVFADARVTPAEIPAGDSDEFHIRLTVGEGYTAGPSRIVLDLPATLGMGRPDSVHQEDMGFVRVFVTNPEVTWKHAVWDIEGQRFVEAGRQSYRGMASRMLALTLSAGLEAGDVIDIAWGDTSSGYGTGTRATTVVPMPDYRARIHVRYFEDPDGGVPDFGRDLGDAPRPVPDAVEELSFRVLPREPRCLRLIRTHRSALLVPLDRFTNASAVDDIAELAAPDRPAQRNEFGAFEFDSPEVGIQSRELPLLEGPDMRDVHDGHNLYWGDIHTHSSLSNDCIEREKLQMTPADLMGFARRRAGLDFVAITDHHQPWDVERNRIGAAGWRETVDAARVHDVPGEFLAMVGIEYRCPRGDTAVVFGWLPEYEELARPEWKDVRKLWEGLAGRDYLAIPHFHNPGRLDDGEWWQGPGEVEPALEIFSCHGSFEMDRVLERQPPLIKKRRPDRNGVWLLDRGMKYGLCANSDGHKGHVGTYGVTAVFAKELTREAIFEAYRARRIYGTTNARIRLVFTGNGALMGSTVPNEGQKTFFVDVTGESELKKVELIGNGRLHRRFAPEGREFRTEYHVSNAEPGYWYVRVTQQDNHVAWSSPVWFE